MKNCIEILQETSLAAMGSKLDSVYKDDLGIHKVSLGEGAADVEYLLEEPQKLFFKHPYSANMFLLAEDLQFILENYIEHALNTASDEELKTLQQAIQRYKIRESIYYSDEGEEGEVILPILGQYLGTIEKLYTEFVAQRIYMRTLDAVRSMDDILAADDVARLGKIETFLQQELGILEKVEETASDDDLEDMQSVLYVADDYAKIKDHGIQIAAKTELDSDDMNTIMVTYFMPGIACLSLDDLFSYGNQTRQLHEESSFMRNQRDYQLSRYIGPLHLVIKERLQAEMQDLLQKKTISVHDVTLIVTHLDLLTEQEPDDIQTYLDGIPDPAVQREQTEWKQSKLRPVVIAEKIKKVINRINEMEIVGSTDLLEACDLKGYLTLLQLKKNVPHLRMQQILEGLHPIVEMGLHKLLMDYKTDLSATITDRHKMKKLQYIDEMLKNFDDRSLSLEQKITNIKATFDKDPYIYKTESLGRFLYRCLCAWLNKPSQLLIII